MQWSAPEIRSATESRHLALYGSLRLALLPAANGRQDRRNCPVSRSGLRPALFPKSTPALLPPAYAQRYTQLRYADVLLAQAMLYGRSCRLASEAADRSGQSTQESYTLAAIGRAPHGSRLPQVHGPTQHRRINPSALLLSRALPQPLHGRIRPSAAALQSHPVRCDTRGF
ncbi:hypothetical protein D3C77_369110 [compost metagenome]